MPARRGQYKKIKETQCESPFFVVTRHRRELEDGLFPPLQF